jgi:hypothetical protein
MGSKLDHIKFVIIIIATSDNIVAVIRVENNLCIVVNKGNRRAMTNFVYNKE